MAEDKKLTTSEAAKVLGVTQARVRQMILAEQLPAEKFGRDLMIREADLALVADRKPGRPKNEPAEAEPVVKTKKKTTKKQ